MANISTRELYALLELTVENFAAHCGDGIYDDRCWAPLAVIMSELVAAGRAMRVDDRRVRVAGLVYADE